MSSSPPGRQARQADRKTAFSVTYGSLHQSLQLSAPFISWRCGQGTCRLALMFEFVGIPCFTAFREETDTRGCGFPGEAPRLPTHSHQRPQPRPARIISGKRPVPAWPPPRFRGSPGVGGSHPPSLEPSFSRCHGSPPSLRCSAQVPPYQGTLLPPNPPFPFPLGFPPPGSCVYPVRGAGGGGGEEDQNLTAWVQSPVLFAGP